MEFCDKMDLLRELAERIMMNTNVKDAEEAQAIARKWMNI